MTSKSKPHIKLVPHYRGSTIFKVYLPGKGVFAKKEYIGCYYRNEYGDYDVDPAEYPMGAGGVDTTEECVELLIDRHKEMKRQ